MINNNLKIMAARIFLIAFEFQDYERLRDEVQHRYDRPPKLKNRVAIERLENLSTMTETQATNKAPPQEELKACPLLYGVPSLYSQIAGVSKTVNETDYTRQTTQDSIQASITDPGVVTPFLLPNKKLEGT
jgi:hypothetical protein